jgi:lipoprotein-anchoring transpeptidase ErfK/SrfK
MDPSPSSSGEAGATPQPAEAQASSAGTTAAAPPAAGSTGALPRRIGPVAVTRRSLGIAAAVLGLVAAVGWAGTGYRYRPYADAPARLSGTVPRSEREIKQMASRLDRRSRELAARLKAAAPRGVYIVIDQTQNRLYLRRDDETLLDAKCSAGSGMVLKEAVGKKREWVFDTPRGRFEVLSMLRDPAWAKPDWAFVEEGQPIPTNPADRIETGSLGEYGLYFGNGYMIHGTLYERLLGRAVSHGCIRVGRSDLRKVWANTRIGTRIYIY